MVVNSSTMTYHHRQASFTDLEAYVLKALFIDPSFDDENEPSKSKDCSEVKNSLNVGSSSTKKLGRLSNEMLLSTIPINGKKNYSEITKDAEEESSIRKSIFGLWKNFETGVHPRQLIRQSKANIRSSLLSRQQSLIEEEGLKRSLLSQYSSLGNHQSEGSLHSFDSDEEVRRDKTTTTQDKDEISESSSIKEDDHREHYDAWEILKDEYAEEHGFSYDPTKFADNGDDDVYNTFRILGTSADDKAAQPHVLTPPLMDALMTFLPQKLQSQNYWLRYSLIRDGASLQTLKHYVNPCKHTIIAIETTDGDVFGSFTSTAWRNNFGFFGTIPAFVWKLRYNRKTTKVSSLFEQAHLESRIDVYMCADRTQRIQVCRHDGIAVGGDETMGNPVDNDDSPDVLSAAEQSGFAIAIFDYGLSRGITNQSTAFRNPSLIGPGDKSQIFDVAGLEVWSFTPCFDVPAAERLETTQYFAEEALSRRNTMATGSKSSVDTLSTTLSQASVRDLLYRRVGDDPESEIRRENFQFENVLPRSQSGSSRGIGQASPRFEY